MTLEEFNIKIRADLNPLKKGIAKAKAAAKEFTEGFKEGVEDAAADTKKVNNEVKKTDKELKKSKKSSDGFFKSMLKFQLVKKAFSAVSAAIKKGITNLYAYSKVTDKSFSSALDRLTSRKTALGNSIAVLASQFITAIEPFISKITEWLVRLVNRLSKFIAEVFKLPSYIQAKVDIMDKWDANIAETRKLISGLDDLNIFERNDGTAATETATRNMFETVHRTQDDIDNATPWKNLIEDIKNFWNTNIQPTISKWLSDAKEWLSKVWGDGSYRRVEQIDPVTGQRVFLEYGNKGIKDWLRNFWTDVMKPGIETIMQKLGDAITEALKKLFESFFSVPSSWADVRDRIGMNELWNKAMGVKPNAKGGVYTSPTLGLVGEYAGAKSNPELITPTSLLDDRLSANNSDLINAYGQIANQIIRAIQNVDISVNLDSTVIARASAAGNNEYYKLTGNTLIQ